MPRKGDVPKRKPIPDPMYADAPLEVRRRLSKFISGIMLEGKKSTAERIVYGAFNLIAERKKWTVSPGTNRLSLRSMQYRSATRPPPEVKQES